MNIFGKWKCRRRPGLPFSKIVPVNTYIRQNNIDVLPLSLPCNSEKIVVVIAPEGPSDIFTQLLTRAHRNEYGVHLVVSEPYTRRKLICRKLRVFYNVKKKLASYMLLEIQQ